MNMENEKQETETVRSLYTQVFNGERILAFFNEGEEEEGWVLANPEGSEE